jgi:hypothetical protein
MYAYKLLLFFISSLLIIAGALIKDEKFRVIISTDIGGSDPDDYQSMVHFLLYADRFDIEGLISSPPRQGRKEHIEEVLHAYAQDYKNLRSHSKGFPAPALLFKVTKQGAMDPQQGAVPEEYSEGAKWIVERAKKRNKKPLYILVWGSITDVAQAVHHAPEIKKKIRIYYIGSWNTAEDQKSRDYVYNNHPDLWLIENNTTFRGMYMGGYQEQDYGNLTFVEEHVKDHGALGNLFWEKKKDIKMGDTPSVLYMLHGDPSNPEGESWGGSFVKTGHGENYWTDNMADSLIENNRHGAKTVNRYRKDYLLDWKTRMVWLKN